MPPIQAWSPDGHSLAYVNWSTGTIWVSSLSGQNGRQLVSIEPGRFATEPRFSPNGRQLAFADRAPGPTVNWRWPMSIRGKCAC